MNARGPDAPRLDAPRFEVKFVAPEVHGEALRHWLRTHPAGFASPFPPRWINSGYFDSHDYAAFRDNLVGASLRAKLRYRWYGRHDGLQPGVLEIKHKRNHLGWKDHFAVDTPPAALGPRWSDIRRCLLRHAGPAARPWLESHPQPVVVIRYHRHYLVSGDRRIRATVDTRQVAYDQRYKARPNLRRAANIPRTAVVEFKFDRHDRPAAEAIIRDFPLRVSRNSKYIIAVRSLQER